MITASVDIQPQHLAEALDLSLQHVRRSREEPGCVSHGVSQDAEDPNRLLFLERWADREALDRHFAVPEARAFARRLGELASAPAQMTVYTAEPAT